jgi:hypothetical protein
VFYYLCSYLLNLCLFACFRITMVHRLCDAIIRHVSLHHQWNLHQRYTWLLVVIYKKTIILFFTCCLEEPNTEMINCCNTNHNNNTKTQWTKKELNFVRCFRVTYDDNACRIGRVMKFVGDKTCADVCCVCL